MFKFEFSFVPNEVDKTKEYIAKLPSFLQKKLLIYAATKLVNETLSNQDYTLFEEAFLDSNREKLTLLINILLDMKV
jgi:hypothetical protein